MRLRRLYFTLLSILASGHLLAQEALTLEQAIQLSLEQNYEVRVAQNNTEISVNAAQNKSGVLPKIDFTAGDNYSINNTQLEFAGGIPPVENSGARSNSLNASLGASYTLFGGLGTVYNTRKLNEGSTLAKIQERITMENTVVQVVNSYYALAQAQQNLTIAQEALAISTDRHTRAQERYNLGGGSKIDVLNAQVDLNTDSMTLMTAQLNLGNAKRALNLLLGRAIEQEIKTEEKVSYNADLNLETLTKELESNSSITLAKQNQHISELDLKLSEANQYPRLTANASYGFNQQNNEVGIVLVNQNTGFNGGLSLNFNLFDGHAKKIQNTNARINIKTSKLRYEEAVLQAQNQLNSGFANYQNALNTLALEQRNLSTSTLNFSRTKDLYALGQATGTQFREAQLNLLQSRYRISNAQFNAKLAEIELLRVSGNLIK